MKRTTIGVLMCGALVAAALAWNSTRERPVKVALVPVERGEVRATVSNTRAGTVNTCNRARMSPTLGGQIASLPVAEGDNVKTGQVLLELWNVDVQARLLLAEKERLAAQARKEEACTASAVSNREAERFDRLYDQKLISEERADSVFGEAQAKAAACRAMQSMVEVSDARVQLAEAHLEQTILRAPFDGTVAEINGEIGEIVTPSPVGVATLPAVDVIDLSCTFVTAPIDEMDAPEIRAGMSATITLDAFPETSFPATVRRVAPYVLSVEKQARTVDVEAEFDQAYETLLPGYSADVEITIDVHEDVLHIPTQALLDNQRVLLLGEDGIIEERVIVVGLRNWEVTEVREGLSLTDRIVLSTDRDGVSAGAMAVDENL